MRWKQGKGDAERKVRGLLRASSVFCTAYIPPSDRNEGHSRASPLPCPWTRDDGTGPLVIR